MKKQWSIVALTSLLVTVHSVWAQADPTCEALLADLAQQVDSNCAGLEAGQACFGAGLAAAEGAPFEAPADIVDLSEISRLSVSTAEEGLSAITLSIATADPDQPIRLILFGEASVTNLVGAPVEAVELPVANAVGYNVNLRSGPGTEFDVAGAFTFDAAGVAIARTANNEWLQVRLGETTAWVSATFARLDGDIASLPTGDNPYSQPMQALSLSSAASVEACGAGSAGLLVQYAGEEEAALQINGADLRFEAGTFLAQAQADTLLSLFALNSALDVSSAGEQVRLQAGQAAEIALGGEDQLTAQSTPNLLSAYGFAQVEGLPTPLLGQENFVCLGGVEGDLSASLIEPKADSASFDEVNPDGSVVITGWAEDAEGQRWWRLRDTSWLPSTAVRTTSLCESIGQVDPVAASFEAGGSGGGVDVSAILAQRTIWEANSGAEVSTGNCTFPPVAMCQHLVAISDNGDGTIAWRGQELQPYTLFSSGENFFSYSGRNQLNNANISLALTFNSASTWSMTMTTVFDNDPQCIRTFNYRATRSR